MNYRLLLLALSCGLALSGCASKWSRTYDEPVAQTLVKDWTLGTVEIIVPDTLTVSDQNLLAPPADIVWHGDPSGDRKAQVGAVLTAAVEQAAEELAGESPVDFRLTLKNFHGVTPQAIAWAPSAVYNIDFAIEAVDPATGEILASADPMSADVPAIVGGDAVLAELEGTTEKERVIEGVAQVIAGWLQLVPDPRGEFESAGY